MKLQFIALLLAIAGLIGLYFPGIRAAVQLFLTRGAWYYIGKTRNGVFTSEGNYQHPLWSGGTSPEGVLAQLPGTTILTLGNGLHIGRATAGRSGAIRANHAGVPACT